MRVSVLLPLVLLIPLAVLSADVRAADLETMRAAGRCPKFSAAGCAAVADLVAAGKEGVALAVRALGDEDAVIRTAARRFVTLADLPDAAGRALAIQEAMALLDTARRGESLLALGELAQPSAEALLTEVARDEAADSRNRIYAAAGLAKFVTEGARQALEVALFSDVPRLQQTAAVALGRHLPAAGDALVRRALAEMTPGFVRIAAAQALVQGKDPRGVPVLALLLAVPDAAVKDAAASGLGALGDTTAVPPLLTMVSDPGAGPAVARALGALGDERAVPVLVTAIGEGAPKARLLAALWSLGDLKGTAAVVAIARWLQEPDLLVARAAAEALGRIGAQAALPHLAAVGDRGDPEFKKTLAWATEACQPAAAPAPSPE